MYKFIYAKWTEGCKLKCICILNWHFSDARKFQEAEQGKGQTDMGLNIPLLMQNKIPEGFETDDKLDVGLRPDEVL